MALVGALSVGTYTDAMVYMLLFGAGTLPAMLGLSLLGAKAATWLKRDWKWLLQGITFLFACYLIVRGMGLDIPYLSPAVEMTMEAATVCH